MNRADLPELHFIAPIGNAKSILAYGILSKNAIEKMGVGYASVAMAEIQARRDKKTVPAGRPLHDYANLYLCARNPMLFRLCCRGSSADLCVFRVSTDVLDTEGAIVTDGNAASEYIGFWRSPEGLRYVDNDLVFAEYWTDPDPIEYMRKKTAKCAEVLVPEGVPPQHIRGAFVSCEDARQNLLAACPSLDVTVDEHLFFRR